MLPPSQTRLPEAFSSSEIRVVVVVFPSEPVTARMGQGQRAKNASISLVSTAPSFRGMRSGRRPGVRKTTSSVNSSR